MNERQRKSLFCSALRSGHIKNNYLIPASEIRVVEEAHFRSFDLLIAAMTKEPVDDYAHYDNLLVRRQLLVRFARTEKCRIDCIRFYPVEVKSDDDTLDERPPNPVIDAILAFGLSIPVLDKNHSKKARGLGRQEPATIICYMGVDDHFEVVSKFNRLVSSGAFNLQKTSLARALGGIGSRAHNRLIAIERILQKLMFNPIYFENLGQTGEEAEFLEMIAGIRASSDGRKKCPSW
jgi:hypothetical protein